MLNRPSGGWGSVLLVPLHVDEFLVELSAVFPNFSSSGTQGTPERQVRTVADFEWWQVKVMKLGVPVPTCSRERVLVMDQAA